VLRALDGYRTLSGVPAALRETGIEVAQRDCDTIIAELIDRRFVLEENGYGLSVVVDPRERLRVADRQVMLRANRFGLRWPEDFPDPAKRRIVRSASSALMISSSRSQSTSCRHSSLPPRPRAAARLTVLFGAAPDA
jgi:hypothetical protein